MAADQSFFVSVVHATGIPGNLFGPYYTYDDAEEILRNTLVEGKNDNGPVDITTKEAQDAIGDGLYNFEGGGGVYIVMSEYPGDEDEDSDEDEEEEEEQRRDEKNGLYGEHVDDAN